MFSCRYLAIAALSLGCSTTPCLADITTPAPEQIAGTTRVDAEGLIELAEQLPDLVVIDARVRMDRRQGYIEDSLSLPDIKTNCTTLKTVIRDTHQPALFYCNGVKCGRSVKSINIAKQCGYKTLYWFRGGFEEWKNKGFPYVKE